MQISAIVQARMSSERLPGKVLRMANGKPMIEYLIKRLRQSEKIDRIIVVTSTEESDLPIVDYCARNNVECFRGSLNNVAERFKSVIEKYKIDHFIRICADSPLIDPDVIDRGIDEFENGDHEIVTNVLKRTFPKGQSFEIFRTSTFMKGYKNMETAEELEHVTSHFYKKPGEFSICNIESGVADRSKINLSVDTIEDFEVFLSILDKMGRPFLDYGWEEIVDIHRSI
jgi:spore coat polysaccharide biosynthesis protein SpsF (cytidylyltransferase family)